MHTDIKRIGILILALASMIVTGFNCNNGCLGERTSPGYGFKMGIRLFPDLDSIQVGDTLFLSLKESTTLQDVRSQTAIHFSNAANLSTLVGITAFLDSPDFGGGVEDFKTILNIGKKVNNQINPSNASEYKLAEIGDTYQFDLALVAGKKGKYVIKISDAANVYRRNDKCTKAYFDIQYQNTDQHLYYLKRWRPDLSLSEHNKHIVYYVTVY